jgi:hypothetical protein
MLVAHIVTTILIVLQTLIKKYKNLVTKMSRRLAEGRVFQSYDAMKIGPEN